MCLPFSNSPPRIYATISKDKLKLGQRDTQLGRAGISGQFNDPLPFPVLGKVHRLYLVEGLLQATQLLWLRWEGLLW